MKQTIKLPLSSIYSLIRDLEETTGNPAIAEHLDKMQEAINMLKETFMPLIDQFEDCMSMPNIDAVVDTDCEDGEGTGVQIDWEQRRFELIKAAMQGQISTIDKNFDYRSIMPTIAKEAIEMADTMMQKLKP